MIISLTEAAKLKREAEEKFSARIHFHDGCGGQYFTVEEPTEELKKYIEDFFASKKIKPVFSENDSSFHVEKM